MLNLTCSIEDSKSSAKLRKKSHIIAKKIHFFSFCKVNVAKKMYFFEKNLQM